LFFFACFEKETEHAEAKALHTHTAMKTILDLYRKKNLDKTENCRTLTSVMHHQTRQKKTMQTDNSFFGSVQEARPRRQQ
jgi:hypothetical protein